MRDLFCIDFDFLGMPVKIFIKAWSNRDDVKKLLNLYPIKGTAMFCPSNDENGKVISYILFNDNISDTIYKNTRI